MGYMLLYPILTINIESNNMNTTNDVSNKMQNDINRQLIDYNSSQNDLIFKTRSRLFKLEHNFRLLVLAIAVAGSVLALTGLAVING